MLDRQPKLLPARSLPQPSHDNGDIGLSDLLAFLRRQVWTIVLTVIAMLAVGCIYLITSPSKYSSTATLLIDTRRLAMFEKGDVFSKAELGNSDLESQVEILNSGRIAEAVIAKLDLTNDPEFMAGDASLVKMIKGRITGFLNDLLAPPPPEGGTSSASSGLDRKTLRAIDILHANLQVARVSLSYVIEVTYTSLDPNEAARIANTITEAYIEDQFEAQVATAQRGTNWLLARIEHLREQARQEDLSAQEKAAIRVTYDNYLQRYTEAVQQQSLPYTEARVITAATPATSRSSPNTVLALIGSIVFGGVLGFGIGLARDLLDRTIRTRQQVEKVVDAPFLGYLPKFRLGGRSTRRMARISKNRVDPAAHIFASGPAHAVTVTAPFSRFTETLRNVKVAADMGAPGPVNVLGVISSVPDEGKSTVAVNLAQLAAQSGTQTLLIDGDVRNPALSGTIVPPSTPGLTQYLKREAQLADLIWCDQATQLHFLPAGADSRKVNGQQVLSSNGMKGLLEVCRRQYKLIVVDLPAVLPVVDVRAGAHLFDGFLFVLEWGATTEDLFSQAVHVSGIEEKVIGTVINKVDLADLRRFETSGARRAASDKYLKSYRHTG